MTRAGPCVIIDVRTSEEFSRGHLEGAENIDFFLLRLQRAVGIHRPAGFLRRVRRKGHRGKKEMEFMRGSGFYDIINISGGFENGESLGLPVERHSRGDILFPAISPYKYS